MAFQAQNVDAVEDSPDFIAELRAATAGAGGVIFADAEGGSLDVTPSRPYGQVSRALLAAYSLVTLDFRGTVLHLENGLNGWFGAGLAGEGGDEEWSVSGRTPSAARAAPPRARRPSE